MSDSTVPTSMLGSPSANSPLVDSAPVTHPVSAAAVLPAEHADTARDDPERAGVARRLQRWATDFDRLRRAALFVAVFATTLGTIVWRERAIFHNRYLEDGDFAVNSLSVDRAEHFHQLLGNYSRVGFHHPGPAYFYLLAAGQWLFYRVLHVVPGQFNGQMLIVFVMAAWFLAMASSLVARATGSVVAGLILAATMFGAAVPLGGFGHMWFPYLYMPMFALFVICCAVLASGRLLALPAFVISAGFLIQGHVSFISTVGVSTLVVAGAFAWNHRGSIGAQFGRHRLAVAVSVTWLILFAIPMVLELLLHYPGPWPDYYKYSTQSKSHPLAATDNFFSWYFSRQDVGWPVFALAAAAGLALLFTDPNRSRRTLFLCWYGVGALECALFYFYVFKGVDKLIPENHYVGYYFLMVPVLLLAGVAAHVAARLRDLHWVLSPLALIVAAALFVDAAGNPHLLDTQQAQHREYLAAAQALQQLPERQGRPAALEGRSFLVIGAVLVQSHRLHDDVCLGGRIRNWAQVFQSEDVCHDYRNTFGVELFLNKDLGPRPVLWSGPTLSLVPYLGPKNVSG